MRRVPRAAAVLLPGRSLLAIARCSTLLHVRIATLRQRGALLHRHVRTTRPGGRSVVSIPILGRGVSLVGPSRPAAFGEQVRASSPHDPQEGRASSSRWVIISLVAPSPPRLSMIRCVIIGAERR